MSIVQVLYKSWFEMKNELELYLCITFDTSNLIESGSTYVTRLRTITSN